MTISHILKQIVSQIKQDDQEAFNTFKKENFHPPTRQKPINILKECFNDFFLICELKKASPSKGVFRNLYDPVKLALEYQSAGAKAISVLTENNFFKGSLQDLEMVRKVSQLPILRKDFIVHSKQIADAYLVGADLVLLITSIVSDQELKELYHYTTSLGMTPLVEIHTEEDLKRALKLNPLLIGINNRDLNHFTVKLDHGFKLIKKIPPSIKVIAESGIKTNKEINQIKENGFSGALIGESILIKDNVKKAITSLLDA